MTRRVVCVYRNLHDRDGTVQAEYSSYEDLVMRVPAGAEGHLLEAARAGAEMPTL